VLVSEAISDIRARLNEKVPRFWSPEELLRWVNEAQRDIARRAEYLQDNQDIAVSDGDGEYTLPSNLLRLTRVEFVPTGQTQVYTLEFVDFSSVDEYYGLNKTSEGYPDIFTVWGFPPSAKIQLYPVPSVAGTLTVYYYRTPTDIADNDTATLEIPDGWVDLVIIYVESLARRKDRDPMWQEVRADYESKLAEMMDLTRRYSDQAGSLVASSGRMVPSYLWSWDY